MQFFCDFQVIESIQRAGQTPELRGLAVRRHKERKHMAQLYYRYSTMNAGKSIEVIKVAHNYEERGKRVLALVPGVDDRYGKGKITSRIGLSRDATIVNEDTNFPSTTRATMVALRPHQQMVLISSILSA